MPEYSIYLNSNNYKQHALVKVHDRSNKYAFKDISSVGKNIYTYEQADMSTIMIEPQVNLCCSFSSAFYTPFTKTPWVHTNIQKQCSNIYICFRQVRNYPTEANATTIRHSIHGQVPQPASPLSAAQNPETSPQMCGKWNHFRQRSWTQQQ